MRTTCEICGFVIHDYEAAILAGKFYHATCLERKEEEDAKRPVHVPTGHFVWKPTD